MRTSQAAGLVLCYHAISDLWPHALAVTPRAFERQLRGLLRRGFRPIPASELPLGRRRSLHVTFDDAFSSVLDVVPQLQQLGVHATVFAVASLAESGAPFAVRELAGELAVRPEHLRTMSWGELRELSDAGIEIGSHTLSHPHLPTLADIDLDRELVESRSRLEDELRRPCRLLAYPYGEHDARVQLSAERAGFAAAFALAAGASAANRFALPRVALYRRDSLARAMLKTSFIKPGVTAILNRVGARPQA